MPKRDTEDWSDGVHFIDKELEKVNAKVRAKTFNSMPRYKNETPLQHLTRANIEFQKRKKQRNAYGRII
ncbi:MAG: hypothetical protein ABSB71_08020 [Candidatus Bathyarchaeia archaeon]|jgi:hypothetical protein